MVHIVWFDIQYPQLWSKLSGHATFTVTFMRISSEPQLLVFPSLWLVTLHTDESGSINRQYDVLVLCLLWFRKILKYALRDLFILGSFSLKANIVGSLFL
jgi:hypothetical protein